MEIDEDHIKALSTRFVGHGLGHVTFPDAGRAADERIAFTTNEVTGGQLHLIGEGDLEEELHQIIESKHSHDSAKIAVFDASIESKLPPVSCAIFPVIDETLTSTAD